MPLTKRKFLFVTAAVLLPGQALTFSGSAPSDSPLPGLDVTLTREVPAGEPIEPIHIDGEHGKALVKMGPKQASTLLANILAPKLENLSGISGKTWYWVLSNHLTEDVILAVFKGGASELTGLQFADDNGATTWGLKIASVAN
ncbi:hypothetical protein [Shimia abyssi]|uniref:Secreted protein n=1 Tax=Shimia abyssi TaxID=1662395 RepID=A0A2P8FFK3_9RHOB|nr:hypothetical protein [Shimia abyssi]PSL20458.1 hypothetical protein CLV88_103100 [Shimia abyssi]